MNKNKIKKKKKLSSSYLLMYIFSSMALSLIIVCGPNTLATWLKIVFMTIILSLIIFLLKKEGNKGFETTPPDYHNFESDYTDIG